MRLGPAPQFLAEPVDEEQAVVGACPSSSTTSRVWETEEICIPWAPSPAMSFWDTSSADADVELGRLTVRGDRVWPDRDHRGGQGTAGPGRDDGDLAAVGVAEQRAPSEAAWTLRAAAERNRLGSLLTSLPRAAASASHRL
jgi:hypothetical protein